jgi:undecaprenyl phosphate N,N'-diacetylbacillosamine 1-phosphate transferase
MYRRLLKYLLDKVFAVVLLVLASPVLMITAVAVYLTMGQPLLFIQRRPGEAERIFTIYKFRTMSDDVDADGNLLDDERRLGRAGKLIRSLSLDELPQLLNIIKGEMSFVGPRPLLIEYLPLYNEEQKHRHDVRPGITGWAQVNGRNAISWNEKFKYDVYYVNHLSWQLDLKILWMSMKKVLKREGIAGQAHVTAEKFNGKN